MTQIDTVSPAIPDEIAALRAENIALKSQLLERRRRRTVRSLLIYTTFAAILLAAFVYLGKSVTAIGYSRSKTGAAAHIEIDGLLEWHFVKQKGKEWSYFGSPRDKPIMKSKWE